GRPYRTAASSPRRRLRPGARTSIRRRARTGRGAPPNCAAATGRWSGRRLPETERTIREDQVAAPLRVIEESPGEHFGPRRIQSQRARRRAERDDQQERQDAATDQYGE